MSNIIFDKDAYLLNYFEYVPISTMSDGRTTITVEPETLRRFKEAKPYESVSADEFVEELIDRYEGGQK